MADMLFSKGDSNGRRCCELDHYISSPDADYHFEGKETDFSRFKLDLGEQDPFFQRIYAAARQVGWGPHDHLEGVKLLTVLQPGE